MDIVLRAAFVWVLLAVAMRVGGKREIAQMSAFDLIMLVTVGDLIGQTVMQEDYSLTAGVLAVCTFALMAVGLQYVTWRFPATQSAIEGRPSIIVRDGVADLDVLHSERIPLHDLHEAARGGGIRDLRDIDLCVLETAARSRSSPRAAQETTKRRIPTQATTRRPRTPTRAHRECQHGPMPQDTLDGLIRLLDLEAIEVNIFRGLSSEEGLQRVFGGQVAGQALVAAARTVDDPERMVHSLHSYFLRPGDPNLPILYDVDRIRDGRSFTTRRVVAIQHGRAIFNLHASFHIAEHGLDHQEVMPPDLPQPDELPDWKTRMEPHRETLGESWDRPRPIDLRYIRDDPMSRTGQSATSQQVWLRAAGELPDDPTLHACVVTYASDLTLLDTTLLPFGLGWNNANLQMASLDHAMWFHRPFRADEWLLYDQQAISTSGSRGLARGEIYTRGGALAASVMQEGLVRVRR